MSSTTGARRLDGDKYYTPQPLADEIVGWLAEDFFFGPPEQVLEPSVGSGAFARAVKDTWPGTCLVGCDIDVCPGWADCDYHVHSAFEDYVPDPTRYDVVIGNPPFSHAEMHAAHANDVAHGGLVAFLLRSAFMHGKKRHEFWEKYPARKEYRLVERPSFNGGGTDSCDYSVFVWTPGRHVPFCETVRRSWK